jgi:hemoglobin
MVQDASEPSLYERVGGMPFFVALVDRFYAGVAGDPELRALYPAPTDLGPARRRLTLFLAQYWGGPTTYSAERGHPRLRSRHFAFPIGADARERWLRHMRAAVDASEAAEDIRETLIEYFVPAAAAMQNIDDEVG